MEATPPPQDVRRRRRGSQVQLDRLRKSFSEGLKTVSEKVFPDSKNIPKAPRPLANTRVASNLPFQVLMYYNCYFSLVWFILFLVIDDWKVEKLGTDNTTKILTPIMLSIWTVTEVARLYFGYVGNLQEKVPNIAASFVLTVFPQFPLSFYFFFFRPDRLPYEFWMGLIMLLFLAAEAGFGYFAVRSLIRSQTDQFFLREMQHQVAEREREDWTK